jgi:hypothetical protein
MPDTPEPDKLEQKIIRFRDAARVARAAAEQEDNLDYKQSLMQIANSWERLVGVAQADLTARDYQEQLAARKKKANS